MLVSKLEKIEKTRENSAGCVMPDSFVNHVHVYSE